MTTSQNRWPLLEYGDQRLHTWVIPARTGTFTLRLRNGSAGFLLAYLALWYAEKLEPVFGRVLDDWGHAVRAIRNAITPSNHYSATAMDLNAMAHPLGRVRTGIFRRRTAVDALHAKLRKMRGVIRWGGDYHGRKDEMHFEIVQNITVCEREARRLMKTPRGRRILAANPSQRAVILS
ncbi:M15 family metallopeptidase [Pimelobacter simplex]|uniref:M15 family metallopeptidase n=1 Tax=Nocardioides simplex TaxID=2045 RepID=UPI003819FA8B